MMLLPLLAGLAIVWSKHGRRAIAHHSPAVLSSTVSDREVYRAYGQSPSCKACHEDEFALWQKSHHALAERPIDPATDATAFTPEVQIHHGSQISSVRQSTNGDEIVTTGRDGQVRPFAAERVIGVEPLRQFLVRAHDGRYQATELAFDPARHDWFDVYGNEDRKPGEWGHWTGRGMTWNMMCATCHNTRVRKNYREKTDSYATAMAEKGVGCEACHGPMGEHNSWQAKHPGQSGDPTLHPLSREAMFAACGSCHSRRAELTGDFKPGDSYFDHYSLTIPDETELFYPDGQVHDEDFEFTAFMGSRMRAANVRCVDCHEPHSAKVRIPGNNLCLVCHAAPAPPAPRIDPATHSHHPAGGRGDACVDCHMPTTVYMQRHARHDHGFTVPDPLLTKQLGIPNACARCHADHDTDWAIQAVERWYGPRMDRPARARTQAIARARRGEPGAAPELSRLLLADTNSFWRAVSANLLKRWAAEPSVTAALVAGAADADALVRAMSVRALEPLAGTAAEPVLKTLQARLADSSRAVRLEAAWALRADLNTNSPPGRELLAFLAHNADQPSGVLQMGVFHLDRGELGSAMGYLRRAVSWDTNSAPLHQALGVALSMEGKAEDAVRELQTACQLAPRDAESQFKLGLALNETGRRELACAALEEAVKLDPQFARAWYNLGLAYQSAGKSEQALDCLVRAESVDAAAPQYPYARATILAQLGRLAEARTAARRALEIQPGYTEAAAMLESLSH